LQDHLKERLTGAAILVVVVVLLVPELFRGPPTTRLKQESGAGGGPPVRSYTIDLRDGAVAEPPAASAAENSAPAAAAAHAANSPKPAAPPASTPAVTAAQPPAAAPAAAEAPTPSASPHSTATKSGWTVQVGSFARRDYAERMVKQVAGKGFTVEVAGPDDHGLYRVRSAPQPSRAAAQALKQKMQATGLKPIVNTTP
jgi:cell division septation protein DedD